ncbi:uncharacterized protein LOC778906 [Ciona intestinalis]
MDQQSGSGEAIHDSSRGGDLFTFLYNFINQSAELQGASTQSGILTAPPNIVVTANIAENIVQNIQNIDPVLQGGLLDNHLVDFPVSPDKTTLSTGCSCAGTATGSANRSVQTTSGPSVSGYQLNNNNNSKEDFIDHSNICKTINDINNNQQQSDNFPPSTSMPQNTGHPMANISVPASGGEFLQAPLHPPPIQIDSSQNFPLQNWNMDAAGNTMNLSEVYATSSLHYPTPEMNQATIPVYPNTGLDQSYLQGVIGNTGFVPQQQFNLHRTNQINHLLQNSLPMQELNSALLRPDNLSVSRSQEMPVMSSAYGINAYHQNSNYNTMNKVSLTQNVNQQVVDYDGYNNNGAVGALRHSSSVRKSSRHESGSEESLVEDRTGEKKLTSTPIPSDAEKTCSSSVSSGSHEESPSPQEVDVGNPQKQVQIPCSGSSFSNVEQQDEDPEFQQLVGDTSIDAAANLIPVAENVVEIDQETGDSPVPENVTSSAQSASKNSQNKNYPQSNGGSNKILQASWTHTKPHTSITEASNAAKKKERMANESKDSWSVRKEERRKRRLHKKRLKAKQMQSDSGEYEAHDRMEQLGTMSTENYSGHDSHSSSNNPHRKHHRTNDSWDKMNGGSEQIQSSQSEQYPTAYRGLIPKATADPTNNANIIAKNNRLQEGHRKDFRKHKHGEKKRSKVRLKSQMTADSTRENTSLQQNAFVQENGTINSAGSTGKSNEVIKPSDIQPTTNHNDGENSNNNLPANQGGNIGVRRWQTVTAVQGPKLPPMLSERDRIPKRGRPSKKMTEQNLKLKAEALQAAQKKADTNTPKAPVVPPTGSNLVSLYTINDKGFIQEIANKPKESRRSKERAEAFLTMLSEISKKSSIQTKTPSAKDAVGAFKAVGVRTRKQASTGSSAEKKKSRSSKVFGGECAPVSSKELNKSADGMNEHGVYTFSELAKQYKISDSILYRAMEQSQRGVNSKSKVSKSVQKLKMEKSNRSVKPHSKTESKNEPLTTVKPTTHSASYKVDSSKAEHKLPTAEKTSTSSTSQFSSESSTLKPISLSSEKATELSELELPSPTHVQKMKRKKKKKKHKRERDEDGKRKRNKEKKKKSKHKHKRSREASDSVFTTTEINNSSEHLSSTPQLPRTSAKTHMPKSAASLSKHKDSSPSVTSNNSASTSKRDRSVSSLSGLDEDQAYDAGDSSSDADVTKQSCQKSRKKSSSNGISTSAASAVFGSSVSSVMPSFHAIKEHGGLEQLSEQTKRLEGHESLIKKHKHKRKKLVRRTKSISDPKFLGNMEELVQSLQNVKISESESFLSSSIVSKSNIFAKKPGLFSGMSNQHNLFSGDAFSYRDPSKNSKSKNPSFSKSTSIETADSSLNFGKSDRYGFSSFCRSNFFQAHGFIKKHTGPPIRPFMSNANANNEQSFIFSTSESAYRNEPLPSKFSNLDSSKIVVPSSESLRDDDGAGSSKKGGKRKRGWPLGRPRGPRMKRSMLDASDSSASSVGSNFTTKNNPGPLTSSAGDNNGNKLFPADSQLCDTYQTGKAKEQDSNKVKKSKKGNTEKATTSSQQAPFADDLVSHIKAVITATLTQSELSTEKVSKTVDIAVADYLQYKKTSLQPDEKTLSHLKTLSKSDSGPPVKKARGRPPKVTKKHKSDSRNVINELEDQKLDSLKEKSTKKSTANQVKSDDDTSDDDLPLKARMNNFSRKRGPGRPRKSDDLTISVPSQKEHVNGDQSRNRTRRSSSLLTSATKKFKQTAQKTKSTIVKTKRGTSLKQSTNVSTNGTISCQKAKVAVGACLSYKALNQQSQSASWIRSLNSPAPGMYDGMQADKHMDEAIEDAIIKCNKPTPPTKTICRTVHDHAHKPVSKKSLESVVAKLKRKQTSVENSESEGNSNANNNGQVKLEEGVETAAAGKLSHAARKISNESEVSSLCADEATQLDFYGDASDLNLMQNRKEKQPGHASAAGISIADGQSTSMLLPQRKKTFLKSGLFSSHFKTQSGEDVEDEDVNELLPMPIHAGNFLLKSRKDFQLPFNIWWMYNRKLISPSQDLATQFIKIEKNVYVDSQPTCEQEEHVCVCQTLSDIHSLSSDVHGCGKECLNRLMYIECSPDTCPCRDKCANRCIQKQQWWKGLERFRTNDRGWGVRTNSDIPEGQFLLEYVGEVVSEREFRRRTIENYNAHNDHYCVQLEAGTVIDGYRLANEGRFVNHSCQPNCEMQKWVVNGEYRVGLFAKRPIIGSEELTYDYNFHAYNLDRQQPCRCGSSECRGVIGGKTQRGAEQGGKTRSTLHPTKERRPKQASCETHLYSTTTQDRNIEVGTRKYKVEQMPSISEDEKKFVKRSRLFLLRNMRQTKINHEKSIPRTLSHDDTDHESDESESSTKSTLLRDAINDVFTAVMTCKDENGVSVAIPFINLPSKTQNPEYYDHVTDPVDLSFVEQKIVTKEYENFQEFCVDLQRVFRNAEKYHGRKSTLGRDVARLRRSFACARSLAAAMLGEDEEDEKKKECSAQQKELDERRKNGDYIRCICGIFKDEGLMIQCEKCYVWQHCDCMDARPDDYNDERAYLCEECDARQVPTQVRVVPQPPSAPPGHTYYLTLMKDDMQVKQGDCVRMIHDHRLRQRPSSQPPVRTSYRLQSHSTPDTMDFFRIKKLWTDDNGDKFAYGHHFLRPHDTRHNEGRIFYNNELIATPFHEIVPLEAVVSICCLMDFETYCLGRPKGVKDEDIYICQHRVDLSFRIVERVIKTRYPTCTKPHVFDVYPSKLEPTKDLLVPEQYRKNAFRRTLWLKSTEHGNMKSDEDESSGDEEVCLPSRSESIEAEALMADDVSMEDNADNRDVKQRRLNGILSKLMKDANSRNLQAST